MCNRTIGHFGIIWKTNFPDNKNVERHFQRLSHFSPNGDTSPGQGNNHDVFSLPVVYD